MKYFVLTMLILFSSIGFSQKEYEDLHNVSNEARQILDSSYWVCPVDSSLLQIRLKIFQKKRYKYSQTGAYVRNQTIAGIGSEKFHVVIERGDSVAILSYSSTVGISLKYKNSKPYITLNNKKYIPYEKIEFDKILDERRRLYKKKYPIGKPPSKRDY